MANEKDIKIFIQKELIRDQSRAGLEIKDNLIESGIIDSLGIQKLVAYLERAFSIEIDDEDLIFENFETIEAISAFVQTKNG